MKIAVYAENYPTDDGPASTGLDRALVPMIASLEASCSSILLLPQAYHPLRLPLHPLVRKKKVVQPAILAQFVDELFYRTLKRQRHFAASSLHARSRCIGSNSDVLLSILGADWRAYMRADRLANHLGLPHLLYSVDDPIQAALTKFAEAAAIPAVTNAVANCTRLYGITQTLCADLAKLAPGVKSQVLELPYIPEQTLPTAKKEQVVYVGNINHLYADSFAHVVGAIAKLRRKSNRNIVFRVTATAKVVSEVLGEVPEFVEPGRTSSRAEMIDVIKQSKASICPISFNETMVRSSFPSKVLEYLAFSNNIIVYSPTYSAIYERFATEAAPTLASTEGQLDIALEAAILSPPDNSAAYRTMLNKYHGQKTFRSTIEASFCKSGS